MPPKADPVEEFIKVLSDVRVKNMLGDIFEGRIKDCLTEIEHLKHENTEQKKQMDILSKNLKDAHEKIEGLESFHRRDNVIITGLPVLTYAEAASLNNSTARMGDAEHAMVTEQSVLALCQELGTPILPADISIAHRLKHRQNDRGPAAVIVRFTSRKIRDKVYAARRNLKHRQGSPIYINEDLTKSTAELFSKVRKLVKKNIIHNAWTSGGMVYMKKNSDDSCRPTKVLSITELPQCEENY
jgi:hypothetical protein